EKRSILEALSACGGNKSEAARRLGITRKTLRKKLTKYEGAIVHATLTDG
ncbi:MAG: helix-turn-helix domain-containing protein, partial [Smithella sp.]